MRTESKATSPQTHRTASPAEEISPGYANYALSVLFLVYVFNFIDRQVLSVFIGPIKEEFGASDMQMGLLVGFAFALWYTVAGIPIAEVREGGVDAVRGHVCRLMSQAAELSVPLLVDAGVGNNWDEGH